MPHDQVYNRADHDGPHPQGLPWVFEWEGEDNFFATEDEACTAQRDARAAHGLDPMTGARMIFKNETASSLEISVPIVVSASIRFFLEPGEELTAEKVNAAVDQLAWAASDDVFRHPRVDGDWSMSVLGVEPDAMLDFYNTEAEGETAPPPGVQFA